MATPDDMTVIENWRASHAHILNAFQTTLRNKRLDNEQIVQRLKRLATIIDKLQRWPNFSLTEMQDIAGCRIIFPGLSELYEFRKNFLSSRISHNHITRGDRYNYIKYPKDDGYRGIHDVFSYNSRKQAGTPWQGLRVEIQYRTNVQHAWATAVEVAGFLTENDPKFGRGSELYIEFFRCVSEVLARRHEGMAGPLPRQAFSEIRKRIDDISNETQILDVFEQFNKLEMQMVPQIGRNVFLLVRSVDELGKSPEVRSFESFSDALRLIGRFEHADIDDQNYDVVVVRNVAGGFINNAYRNYFSDTREFVRLLNEALE